MPEERLGDNEHRSLHNSPAKQETDPDNHNTTLQNVEMAIASIQTRQEARRELMDMTRLASFVEGMHQFETTVEKILDNTLHISPIWADFKFILETSSTLSTAFDAILDAYQSVGEVLPAFTNLQGLLQMCPDSTQALRMIYTEIFNLHTFIIRLLKRSGWRQTFGPSWKDFKDRLKTIVASLRAAKDVLDSQSSTLQTLQGSHPPAIYNTNHAAGHFYDNVSISGGTVIMGDYHAAGNMTRIADYHAHLSEQLSQLQLGVDDAKSKLEVTEQSRRDDRKTRLLSWLAASSTSEHHEIACNQRLEYPDTGLWILDKPAVSSWLYDDLPKRSALWLNGIPGAGKTILASIIIEACMKVANAQTSYFYCKNDDPEFGTPVAVLKGLIVHSIHPDESLMPYFDEQRRQSNDTVLKSEHVAKRLLEMLCREGGRRYLILDGLDECPTQHWKTTLSHLTSIIKDMDRVQASKIRLLIVSQAEPEIRRALSEATELRLNQKDNKNDITTFVSNWTARIQGKFKLSAEQEEFIRERVIHRAAGQFLYAKLVVQDNLYAQPSKERLVEELKESTFPNELSAAYERILVRIKSSLAPVEWTASRRLLGWMTCAARPLKWHEMQGAHSIDTEDGDLRFESRKLLRSVEEFCGALVLKIGDRVFLVHSTVKQYISRSKYIDTAVVECELATLCLHYLTSPCFNTQLDNDMLHRCLIKGDFAFSDYAVAKWMHHFHRVIDCAPDLQLDDSSGVRESAIEEFWRAVHYFACEYEESLETNDVAGSPQHDTAQLYAGKFETLVETSEYPEDLKLIWEHITRFRKNVQNRNSISIGQLQTAMKDSRAILEQLANGKDGTGCGKEYLEPYYGTRLYKCAKITCFYFHEGFKDARTRNQHLNLHDRPYQCPQEDCASFEFGFSSKQQLAKHVETFHPDLEVKSDLFKDIELKLEVSSGHRCDQCDKIFTRRAALKDHQSNHAGLKPYKCSKCGRPFTRKNDCTRHEKIHERRPY